MAEPEVPFPLKSEPGVPFPMRQDPDHPFPLKSEEDRGLAEKFGFCRDCPFPMKGVPGTHEFAAQELTRVLGVGNYTANEIAGVVTIAAAGTVPNVNTVAQLVQLPLMIWPPRFALFFTSPAIVLPATHPFKVEATLLTHQRLETIIVQDRDGVHSVPVENF